MEVKELRQKARNELIDKALGKHSFLGLVKKSEYKHLLEYSLDQADREIDMYNELQTTKAKLIFCEEELRRTKNTLENNEKTFVMFDWLLGEGEDIRLEEFVRCLLEQMPSDISIYNTLEEIYQEYKESENGTK